MIFLDSNIPMYLVGAEHPHKARALLLLERLVSQGERLVTDVEVLQEILHRYVAIVRLEAIPAAFEALLGIVDEVFEVRLQDVLRAKEIVLHLGGLSARDALHAAVMEARGVHRILTFDGGFDRLPGLDRLA